MRPIKINSIKFYGERREAYIKHFLKFTNKKTIRLYDLEKYYLHLKNNNSSTGERYTKSSVVTYFYGVASKLKRTLRAQGRQKDLADLIYFVRDLKIDFANRGHVGYVPAKKEIKKLINNSNSKLALIIRVYYYTGCRLTEILNLKIDKVTRIKNDASFLVFGKGGYFRLVFIPWKLYCKIIKEFNSKVYLFENKYGNKLGKRHTQETISDLGKKVLNKKIHAHLFRKSFATHVYQNHPQLKDLADYMGNSPATLAMYYIKSNLSSKKIYQTLLTKEDKERYL